MKVCYVFIASLVLLFCSSCAPWVLLTMADIQQDRIQENTIYRIDEEIDLQGLSITLPLNCTLCFSDNGCLKNGTIIGQNTLIRYTKPFIGESLTVKGCTIIGKELIKDTEVFLSVNHTQNEIQTLFDISGGIKLKFSKGTYKGIEKIVVDRDIDADFSNSTIQLYHDKCYVAECFYMEPWVDKHVNFFRIKNLVIKGKRSGFKGSDRHRSCIQLFYVSEVVLDGVSIDQFYGGPNEYKNDGSDLADKTRLGTNIINIINYDKCVITNCSTNDLNKEIFWCVPNKNPKNITYFTNNKSTSSSATGSASFFTLIDGRCVVENNEVYNYNGSAFNLFCYDSEIANNRFYDGKRSTAIDLSEGELYRAKNVNIHDNHCTNTKGLITAYGESIRIKHNTWVNNDIRNIERCIVIIITSRDKDIMVEGYYIGCDNNPPTSTQSLDIVVEGNICRNEALGVNNEIRFACVRGNNISFCNNSLCNLSVPVVQLVEGTRFVFKRNAINNTQIGHYAELLINKVVDICVTHNAFSRNFISKDFYYTVHMLNAGGYLIFRDNKVRNDSVNFVSEKVYVPCFVETSDNLNRVDYYVRGTDDDIRIETRINYNGVDFRTNITHN